MTCCWISRSSAPIANKTYTISFVQSSSITRLASITRLDEACLESDNLFLFFFTFSIIIDLVITCIVWFSLFASYTNLAVLTLCIFTVYSNFALCNSGRVDIRLLPSEVSFW